MLIGNSVILVRFGTFFIMQKITKIKHKNAAKNKNQNHHHHIDSLEGCPGIHRNRISHPIEPEIEANPSWTFSAPMDYELWQL